MRLFEARCRNCARLLFKFSRETSGAIEVKCWAKDCKQINLVHLTPVQSVAVLST